MIGVNNCVITGFPWGQIVDNCRNQKPVRWRPSRDNRDVTSRSKASPYHVSHCRDSYNKNITIIITASILGHHIDYYPWGQMMSSNAKRVVSRMFSLMANMSKCWSDASSNSYINLSMASNVSTMRMDEKAAFLKRRKLLCQVPFVNCVSKHGNLNL